MFLRTTMVTITLLAMASAANAENCKQYPPGPNRFECVSRNHPGAADKLEPCKQEGLQMGLNGRRGGGGGLRQYVQACMQQR
jgi:hypothetical protein